MTIEPSVSQRVRLPRVVVAVTAILSVAASALATSHAAAQSSAQPRALRTTPVEAISLKPGPRDLGAVALHQGLVFFGGPTGGSTPLYSYDAATGRQRWTFLPPGMAGSTGTRPVIAGGLVIAPFGASQAGAVIAVSIATGKEVWRALEPSQYAGIVTDGEMVFVVTKECELVALAAPTGQQRWRVQLRHVPGGACTTWPVVRDGTVYAQIMARAPEGTAGWPDARYLAAFDAATGVERWRHRALHPDYRQGAAPGTPVVTDDAVYFGGENALYALDRGTGQLRFPPVFVRRRIDGFERPVTIDGLVDAGQVLIGATPMSLIAFDKRDGRVVWERAGNFNMANRPMHQMSGVAAGVFYVGGTLSGDAERPAVLHAFDVASGEPLWRFSRSTADAHWRFGAMLPVDGALWVDAYGTVIKLQAAK